MVLKVQGIKSSQILVIVRNKDFQSVDDELAKIRLQLNFSIF